MQDAREQRMVVVPYHPQRRLFMLGAGLLFGALCALVSGLLAYDKGRGIQAELLSELAALREGAEQDRQSIAELEQELVNLRQGARVDRDSA